MLCHGYALNLRSWGFQREALRRRARGVTYDHRGHGRSGHGSRDHADIAQRGKDLLAVLEDLPATITLLPENTEDPALVAAVWRSGVRGLLPRDLDSERLDAALQAVRHDLTVIDPMLALELQQIEQAVAAGEELLEDLTPRELEVLQLVSEGLSNKGIARSLGISEHTVKFHVNAILGKLGAQSRTEAVVRATRAGLISL